jgi:hypothetical protein
MAAPIRSSTGKVSSWPTIYGFELTASFTLLIRAFSGQAVPLHPRAVLRRRGKDPLTIDRIRALRGRVGVALAGAPASC